MSVRKDAPSPLVRSIYEREMSVEEFDAQVAAARADSEDFEAQRQLIRWFSKRYPTAKARLAFARRHYAQAMRRFGALAHR